MSSSSSKSLSKDEEKILQFLRDRDNKTAPLVDFQTHMPDKDPSALVNLINTLVNEKRIIICQDFSKNDKTLLFQLGDESDKGKLIRGLSVKGDAVYRVILNSRNKGKFIIFDI